LFWQLWDPNSDISHIKGGAIEPWNPATTKNQHASQDEPDLWMPDSKSFDVDGKMQQTNARRLSCPNKSASGNHLGQNDQHPPRDIKMPDEDWIKTLEDGRKVKFVYQELPEDGAFITAQIERNEVVYSVVLAKARNPLSRADVESHFKGALSKKWRDEPEAAQGVLMSKASEAEKPAVTLPGTVEQIIPANSFQAEKAQISVDDAEDLYKEIRVENTLQDENGMEVSLKQGAHVEVTIEAEKDATVAKK
jgi:hypothetical protein